MQEHEKWLAIAEEDLAMAKLALRPKFFSSATYHCQQAAEKSLKSYLVCKGKSVIKTHDLVNLLEECMKLDRSFEKLYQAVRDLNPFSTKFRYPTEFDIPDRHRTQAAIKQAGSIVRFVSQKISAHKTGQMRIS